MTTASRSRFLISESALNLSLTPPPSAGTDSLSSTSSASSHSSSSFAVRRKLFRPTSVPNDPNHEARVHSESSSSLVSLGIVLVVSGAQPDSPTRRPAKRPHRLIEREPKEKNPDGQTKEQPRYKPPPPDMPLSSPVRRRQRPLKFTRTLPLYHPLRPLPPLPPPANSEPSAPPESQNPATRSSGRTRRPPPRNLEHLIVAVSNTAKQRQGSPAKKRKVVVIAADEMDVDVDAESESGSFKKKYKDTSMELVDEPLVEETDSSSGRARRAARRSGGKESVTPTPPPQEPPSSKTQTSRASAAQSKKPVSTNGRLTGRRVTRRNSDETSSEEKDTAEPTPVPTSVSVPRRTSARRSAGVEHAEAIAVSVRA